MYKDLHELITHSSSSRKYLLSLPVWLQMKLHERNDYICSLQQLHQNAYIIEKTTKFYIE